jgi:3-oxoacyl-[acyl-carrier protein] reductase
MSRTTLQTDGYARLDGRGIVVTGGTGGIGQSTVEELVRAGAQVVVAHSRGEDAAAADLATALGDAVIAQEVDVCDEASVAALFEAASARLPQIDGLVNSAGVMEQAPIRDLTPAMWSHTIGVNLTGAYMCTRIALRHLDRSAHAAVVNVASQLAYSGAQGVAAYCASKAGLLGLTRALAHDLPLIRVNAVAPGPIDSPMTRPHATPGWVEAKTSKMVMRRFGEPHEVAAAIRFLLSDEASFFTGQTLSPNGGGVMP